MILKSLPEIRDWAEARAFLAKGRGETKQRRVAHNTWIEFCWWRSRPDTEQYIALRHYNTNILVWRLDRHLVINSCVCTVTTLARINHFLPAGVRAFSYQRDLHVQWRDLKGGFWVTKYVRPILISRTPPFYLGDIRVYDDPPAYGSATPLQIFPRYPVKVRKAPIRIVPAVPTSYTAV